MGATNGFLVALGLGDGTLEHMKQVANSVKPAQIEQISAVFSQGSAVMADSHGHLESSVDKVVTGWKGKAASAASTKVVQSALVSQQSGQTSTQAQTAVQQYAAKVADYQSKINSIPAVDTSFHAAVQANGGAAASVLNPGGVGAQMAAAQAKSFQHREQAAGHLNEMDDASNAMAAQMKGSYTAIPSPPMTGQVDNLPGTISVRPVHANGGGSGPSMPTGPSGGSSTWSPPSINGGNNGPVATFNNPGNNGGKNPGGKNPGGNNGTGTVVIPDGPGTTTTGITSPPGSVGPVSPPVALPDPVSGGGGGGVGPISGIVGGAIVGGGLIGAGGISGVGRGGAGGSGAGSKGGALSEEEARLRASGRSGMASAVDEDGSVLRGRGGASDLARSGASARGFNGAGEDMPLRGNNASELSRSGLGGRGFGGGAGMNEEMPLRASGLGGASAGELAAGQRGSMMPGGGGGGGRREDEDELNKRPDYLVETDDIWGDGRLAAPPVLG